MNIVVGSGPSGVAAASALLDAGKKVLMLDAGGVLEPERAALVASLAAREPTDWDEAEIDRLREPLDSRWTPKRPFGSAYPYALDDRAGLEQRGTRCMVSEAKGGLSSVWGAAILPFAETELNDWPFPASELRPFYSKAAALLGVSGSPDELASLFPFHSPPEPPLNPSLQTVSVLSHLSANSGPLKAAGFVWGRARHAASAKLCRQSGLCLSGCPYEAIWSAAAAVERLKSRPGFRYEGGVRALGFEARAGGARLHAARAGASRTVYDASKLFVACGPLATARLAVGSLGPPPGALALLTQPYFLLPLLLGRGVPGAPEERLHTLAQIFLELNDPGVSKRLVHMQIYGHNEYIERRLRLAPGFVRKFFAARLLAIQGYLHSDEAAPISVEATGRGEDCRLRLRAGPRAATKAAVGRAAAKLSRHAAELGFTPLSFLLKHGLPGEGNHVGGVFPMKASPGPWQTDRLGRLPGVESVHLVDSSILPSLPATTFTYAVMANAGRIATEAVS